MDFFLVLNPFFPDHAEVRCDSQVASVRQGRQVCNEHQELLLKFASTIHQTLSNMVITRLKSTIFFLFFLAFLYTAAE